jgi:hypothetical protein
MIWSSCLFIGFAKLFLSRQTVYHLLQLLALIALSSSKLSAV